MLLKDAVKLYNNTKEKAIKDEDKSRVEFIATYDQELDSYILILVIGSASIKISSNREDLRTFKKLDTIASTLKGLDVYWFNVVRLK